MGVGGFGLYELRTIHYIVILSIDIFRDREGGGGGGGC